MASQNGKSMKNDPTIFFSNRVEVLFQKLKEDLFVGSHPLTRRMVIVPSPAIKTWLMYQMANDPELGVAAGVEIGFVDPMVNRLSLVFSPYKDHTESKLLEPSELELSLALEREIRRIIQEYAGMLFERQQIWTPLLEYLGVPDGMEEELRKVSKRIIALATTLAKLFMEYGRFGGRVIEGWANERFPGWQQQLWKRMEEVFAVWNYPYRKLGTMQVDTVPEEGELQIHAFALSYLSSLQHRYLMKIGQHIPLHYYLISPCQKFWSDILTDRESVRLQTYWQQRGVAQAQQVALEEYLRDNNPLLANFGRLGREMALQVEESGFHSGEVYVLPASITEKEQYVALLDDEPVLSPSRSPLSLLEALQSDLVLLRNPDETQKVHFDSYDGTIQVHAAPKPLREVQVIYDVLMGIIDKHRQDETPITPGDVIVMAPNLREYVPFIKGVFGAPESELDYQLSDLEMPARNPYIQGFLHLLQLPFSRWDAATLVRLFEYTSFHERQGLTVEDVSVLRNWIKLAGIRWGRDYHHRNELLKRDHCSKGMSEESWVGTWEEGLGRLCEGLAMFSDERQEVGFGGKFAPLDRIESTQGELLGKTLLVLRSLLEDLRTLHDGTKMTLAEWSVYLRCLCEAYFSSGVDEDHEEGFKVLMKHIDAIGKATLSLGDATFAFDSIYRHLESGLQLETVNYRESHLHAVRFCSLLPMRAIPAKVIVLMGLHDGAFPRADVNLTLNLLFQNQAADYYPSQVDFDRYIFLEAILSARSYFVLSYVSHAAGESKEQLPSLLLTELLTYLDKAYCLPEGNLSQYCVVKHPFFAFDQSYFSSSTKFNSYSKSNYEAALAYYCPEKKPQHSFLPTFSVDLSNREADENELIVEMSELAAFARNPLKVYFNKTLGIYLEKEEDRTIKCEEELQLSPLDSALLSREGLMTPVSEVLVRAEKLGRLPRGPFRELGYRRVMQEVEVLRCNLAKAGVVDKQLFSIEFSDRYVEVQNAGPVWKLPPLHLESPEVGRVKIVGKLDTVSLQGLVVFGEDKIEEAIKVWPMLLIFCCLIKTYKLPITSGVIFAKNKAGKSREANFENPEGLLIKYLRYYFQVKMSPSPLLPACVGPILSGSVDDLQDVFKDDDPFKQIYDEYIKWLADSSSSMDFSSAIDQWKPIAQELFVDLAKMWYPKSLQKVTEGADEAL